MSALRQRLTRPGTWLILALATWSLAVADMLRDPSRQALAPMWIGGVRMYQAHVSPALRGRVRCRYVPVCSEYSIQAVERHGLARGLRLTARRVASCRTSVPLGTIDPVPAR